jgi:Family of unknown function (DUF5681)
MAEQTRPPKASPPNGGHSAVGYGKPPVHTRFKPGQSGNPKGRRKGQRNVHTVFDEVLSQRITIREGNRTRSVSKLDAVIVTMVNAALRGDAKAQTALIAMMRSLGMTGEPPPATNPEPFTADDQSLIADYFRRHGSTLQLATDIDGKATPADATPSEWKPKS